MWHEKKQSIVSVAVLMKVGTFTRSILIHIGQETGRFVQAGLEVEEVSVSSSLAQFEALSLGDLGVAITSPDNVIAYRYLSANPLKRKLNVKILGALDRGLGLSLCVAPGFQSLNEIGALTLGVDVPQSGFAFVGYGLLDRLGYSSSDYTVQTMGSTPKRAKALIEGECNTTILNAGNEIYAVSMGCTKVSSVTELGPYLGTVIAAIPNPEGSYQSGVLEFALVLSEIVHDIKDGKLGGEVISVCTELFGMTPSQGKEHYKVLLDEENGLIHNGKIDRPSIDTLIGLRRRFLPSDELNSIQTSLVDLVRHKDLLIDAISM